MVTRSSPWSLSVGLAMMALATAAQAQVERYRLTIENTWSTATHPGLLPPDAHFSWLAGGTHDGSVQFWAEGQPASPGVVQMAETGATFVLEAEVAAAVASGSAGSVLAWHTWFCPAGVIDNRCGALVVEFDVDPAYPLVTLVTMLGPSPDWFVGVDGFALRDGSGWIDQAAVDLRPFDGGTRSANVFALGGPRTVPPDPITRITTASGQLVGPGSLGSFVFQRVGALAPRGCATPAVGFGAPTLEVTRGATRIGRTFDLSIRNPSPTATVATLGLQMFLAPGRSPRAATSALGICWNLPLPFGGTFVPVPTSTVLSLALPPDPAIVGAEVDWQVFVIDPSSSAVGLPLTTSRGLTTSISI